MNDLAVAGEVDRLAAAAVTPMTACDRDAAESAKVAFVRPGGAIVALCQHHANIHGTALEAQGFTPVPVA
jgi:hypothetical protein